MRAEQYKNFRHELERSAEAAMESRRFAIILFGPPTSGKSTLSLYASETLHLPIIHAGSIGISPELSADRSQGGLISDDAFIPSLVNYLKEMPPHGYIFDGIPRTKEQARALVEWSSKEGIPLHVFNLKMSEKEVIDRTSRRLVCPTCNESYHARVKPPENAGICDLDGARLIQRRDDGKDIVRKRLRIYEGERDKVLKAFGGTATKVWDIDGNGTVPEVSREFFRILSPISFENPTLARDYFHFRDTCKVLRVPFILISGACSYIYWGRRALKDIDILVPARNSLNKLAKKVNLPIEEIRSSYAKSRYLNFSSGVEVVTDLSVVYKNEDGGKGEVPFTFEELKRDARQVRFMGEKCKIMSPESLVLFKFCLGRLGIDDYGHHKDDYEDARGVLISQNIDLESLRRRAERLGALKRVVLAEQILGLEA